MYSINMKNSDETIFSKYVKTISFIEERRHVAFEIIVYPIECEVPFDKVKKKVRMFL
jgi:hypothetical protein